MKTVSVRDPSHNKKSILKVYCFTLLPLGIDIKSDFLGGKGISVTVHKVLYIIQYII